MLYGVLALGKAYDILHIYISIRAFLVTREIPLYRGAIQRSVWVQFPASKLCKTRGLGARVIANWMSYPSNLSVHSPCLSIYQPVRAARAHPSFKDGTVFCKYN